jgi:O-antigen ligase/polysaccharide polymerase Wzy-like membrane protein
MRAMSTLSAARGGATTLSADRALTGLVVLVGGCLIGICTVISPQLGCAVAMTGGVVLLFAASARAGLLALWATWLVVPGLRRLFGLLGPYLEADPLSVAPFVATAAVAAIQISRTRLDAPTRRVLALAGAGLAIGVPAGAASPDAMLYGVAAYGGGMLAYVLGRTERAGSVDALTLRRALVVGAPAVALYGIAQYFLPLTAWDARWLETVDFTSIGAPEEGRVRVFSTLNAPGTLAPVLAVALLFFMASARMRTVSAIGAVVVGTGLALTYVRGAWVAFAVAALLIAVLARTAPARLTVGLCGLLVVGALAAGESTPTTAAISERLQTFGSLESDESAKERRAAPATVVPEAAGRPAGHGLGSAGEAARLRPGSTFKNPDSGYLSLLYQLGPVGLLLVMAALAVPIRVIARHVIVAGARDRESVLLLAFAAFALVVLFFGDLFYGVTGAILWYLLGRGTAVATR